MQRRRFFWLGLGALVASGCSGAAARDASRARRAPRTIHVAGDSTAAVFETGDPRVGWGALLAEQLAGVEVRPAARSGRSSKSYLAEGHWTSLLSRVAGGDLVLIEFGHNDQKPDPARATDAATTFRDNLRRYVNDARARGGVPVLLTPICRRRFEGRRIRPTHGEFPEATRQVAAETQTPLIDLTEQTRALLEQLGPDASAQLFAPDDRTHTNRRGASEIARLVARSLVELQLGVTAKAV